MGDGEVAIALYGIYLCIKRKQGKKKKARKIWVKEWLKNKNDHSHRNLLSCMEITAPEEFKNLLRMDSATYMELLQLVTPLIQKQDTQMRKAVTANERLSATLRFLASGQSFEKLKFLTKISAQCLGILIIETCEAIISVLKNFIKMPQSAQEWEAIAAGFEKNQRFNHCVGAIDGKHVHITKPAKSGSAYFNYKKRFSIVMMAVVNSNYEFMFVDVGANGKVSDAGVFGQTKLKTMYDHDLLYLPVPETLPCTQEILPYVFVGDDAFPLLENFMKPYNRYNLTNEEKIFNYRLSKARRIAAITFGILERRFRIFYNEINLSPEKAAKITLACCYLHNFLISNNAMNYLRSSEEDINTITVDHFIDLKPVKNTNEPANAKEVRNKFCNYFNTVGAVPWQQRFV